MIGAIVFCTVVLSAPSAQLVLIQGTVTKIYDGAYLDVDFRESLGYIDSKKNKNLGKYRHKMDCVKGPR